MGIDPGKLEGAASMLLATWGSFSAEGARAPVVFGHVTIRPVPISPGDTNGCGTMACHAGWLAVVLAGAGTPSQAMGMWGGEFYGGIDAMDEWLGLSHAGRASAEWGEFPDWADRNPDLWGNEHGGSMYDGHGHIAFGEKPDGVTLEVIANWYKDVAKRIRESENED